MRCSNFIPWMAIMVSIAILQAASSKDVQNPEVKLSVLNSMERIGQHQQLFGENQASIQAAKNEVESFQVVVGAIQTFSLSENRR